MAQEALSFSGRGIFGGSGRSGSCCARGRSDCFFVGGDGEGFVFVWLLVCHDDLQSLSLGSGARGSVQELVINNGDGGLEVIDGAQQASWYWSLMMGVKSVGVVG